MASLLGLFKRLRAKTRVSSDLAVIRSSGLFDVDWYSKNSSFLSRVFFDPIVHYVLVGAGRGRNPHRLFDTNFYVEQLSPHAREESNPLVHYQLSGAASGKNPCLWFDTNWYRTYYDLALEEGVTPLLDYCRNGYLAGRAPHPLFDVDWYKQRYAGHVENADPVIDYIYDGSGRGRVPHRALDGADRIQPDGPALGRAVRIAAATRDPMAPRRITLASFDEEASAAFVSEIRQKAGALLQSPPTVSVIMPTKDRAQILPVAVESVRRQSYPHWELLVVDDGSGDDGTRGVVELFGDPRIRYVPGDGNGAAAARNIGIAKAGGDLIAYLDSDNQWTPEFLETIVGYVLSDDLDLAYPGMRMESEEGVRYRGRPFDYPDLVRVNYIDLNGVIHKRELIERSGVFDTSLRRMIDWDLLLRYTKDTKVGYAPFIGVVYDEYNRKDRITVSESINWKFIVLNRYLVEWERLQAEAATRDQELVSIVIPVYGKFEITNSCLESIYRHQGGRPFEIILVNNKSDQATLANMVLWAEARSSITVEAAWTNFNFALACNVGFARSRGATIVFLNNDTLVTPGWLEPLVDELSSGAAGAVQPKLLYPDGTVQSIGAVFSDAGTLSYMLYRGEPGDAAHVNHRRGLQAIHGACFAVRADDFARLKGFDTHYVNGQEDIDFCLRLAEKTGKGVAVVPQSTVFHLEGKTRGRNPYNRQNRTVFVDRWKGRIKPDDRAIYESDGFIVGAYRPDSEGFAESGIAVYTPELTRGEPGPRMANHDEGVRP